MKTLPKRVFIPLLVNKNYIFMLRSTFLVVTDNGVVGKYADIETDKRGLKGVSTRNRFGAEVHSGNVLKIDRRTVGTNKFTLNSINISPCKNIFYFLLFIVEYVFLFRCTNCFIFQTHVLRLKLMELQKFSGRMLGVQFVVIGFGITTMVQNQSVKESVTLMVY